MVPDGWAMDHRGCRPKWLENGKMSNLHSDDAARLLRLGWSHATMAQRGEVRGGARRMIQFAT
jgi:hypothetical protein